jgi:large subunit ribosomal protein L17
MSRHGVVGKRLSRNVGHRRALLKNLATSVIAQGLKEEPMERHVVTTVTKAKAVRGLVERLITYAKQGDLAARRQAARFVTQPKVLSGLFETLAPRYAKRAGGYTRVLKLSGNRMGDASQMAVITLVEEEIKPKTRKKAGAKGAAKKAKAEKKVDITKAEAKPAAEGSAPAAETPAA